MKLLSLLTGELAGSGVQIYKKRSGSPFWQFVFHNKVNRRYMAIAVAGTIMQFIVFKMLYPFPDFISDSYSYISTNLFQMDVNLWPIGYSRFLSIIHEISYSDTFLTAIQYFLLEVALGCLFFTILFLYRPARNTSNILFVFYFFNPMCLYISNCVLSDAVFASLTIVFISQFLWMLYKPNLRQIIIQGIIIGVCFTIRYTAVYYPFVAIAGFFLSRQPIRLKLLGCTIGVALMTPYYLYTEQKTKEATGTPEFSVFGGWQLANNALYMYEHIDVDSNALPTGTLELDRMVRHFYKKVPAEARQFDYFPGTYFIKMPFAVLKPYMAARYSYGDPPSLFRAWGKVSPTYQKYGSYLISHYPLAFTRYFIWLNTKNYFMPYLEIFGRYNHGEDDVPSQVQDWFHYTTPNIYAVSSTIQGDIFLVYPILFMLLNFFFIAYFLWSSLANKMKNLTPLLRRSLLFLSAFFLLNFCFSIFATPIVLRYEICPLIFLFTISILLLESPVKAVPQTIKSAL